jgi:hypothetical protein
MYTQAPWELVADLLGSAEHTLGTIDIRRSIILPVRHMSEALSRVKTNRG